MTIAKIIVPNQSIKDLITQTFLPERDAVQIAWAT